MTPFAAFQGIESDPANSPSLSAPDGGDYGLPLETATHKPYPEDVQPWRNNHGPLGEADHNWRAAIHPAEGGQPGPTVGLGWTTGIKPNRANRRLFDGRTLVVGAQQANNPNVGRVGLDNHANRLAAGVGALSTDYLPTPDQIAASFTQPRGSALVRELQSLGQA
jgi:hypothetical protein